MYTKVHVYLPYKQGWQHLQAANHQKYYRQGDFKSILDAQKNRISNYDIFIHKIGPKTQKKSFVGAE